MDVSKHETHSEQKQVCLRTRYLVRSTGRIILLRLVKESNTLAAKFVCL
jgi:hypothetical protein